MDGLYQKLGRHYALLSRPQRRFLHAIAAADGIGVTTLADNFEISAAGATRMLDSLEADGLIVRRRQIQDARHVKVYITPVGAAALADADDIYLARLDGMLAALSADERRSLQHLLHKIDLTHGQP